VRARRQSFRTGLCCYFSKDISAIAFSPPEDALRKY